MSGADRRAEAPQDPPWSPELLADFHAGLLDQETHEALHAQLRTDPQAREVLSALEATSAQLHTLRLPAIPDHVTERIEAALQAEAPRDTVRPPTAPIPDAHDGMPPTDTTGHAPAVDIDSARQHSTKAAPGRANTAKVKSTRMSAGLGWTAGLVAVAAAVAGAVVVTMPLVSGTDEEPLAAESSPAGSSDTDPAQPAPLALRSNDPALSGEQFATLLGSEQYTGLSDPNQLIGCLQANGVDSREPLGAREIILDDRPAQLLILSTEKVGEFRMLTVGPGCSSGRPATIADTTFGG